MDYLIYQWKGSIDDLFAFVVLHAVQDEAHREENDRTVLKNYNNCMKEGSLDQRGDTNPYVCMQALERMKRRIANARQKDKSDPRVQQEESS